MKKLVLAIFILMSIIGDIAAQPRIWNLESLKKARLENSTVKDNILKDADKLLSKKMASIVDKTKPAPSGDMHDYMSCGPYWWPDPANPTGPYIRKDGESNKDVLTQDKKNLGSLIYSVIQLSLAYNLTADEKYAVKAVDNLRIWFLNPATKMNPNVNYGQTIFGHLKGKGRGAGMIETYRFVELLDGVELLKKSPALSKTDLQDLKNWFTEYLNWMITSEVGNQEYKAKNNHGTAFDVQLTRVALFVGREDIARKYINDFAERRIFNQIEPDGKQPAELARTKALHYSAFNITHLLDMCLIAKTLDIDLLKAKSTDGRSIMKAIEFMAQYAGKPQSQFPYSQINEWDADRKLLIFQLYRVDKTLKKKTFKKYYETELNDSKRDYKYLLL